MSSFTQVVKLLKRVHAGEVGPERFEIEAARALYVQPGEAPLYMFALNQEEEAKRMLGLNGGILIKEPWALVVSDDDILLAEMISHRFGGSSLRAQEYIQEEMKAFDWDETQKPAKD